MNKKLYESIEHLCFCFLAICLFLSFILFISWYELVMFDHRTFHYTKLRLKIFPTTVDRCVFNLRLVCSLWTTIFNRAHIQDCMGQQQLSEQTKSAQASFTWYMLVYVPMCALKKLTHVTAWTIMTKNQQQRKSPQTDYDKQ